ncbi:MAG: insulinase family protein [Bacteriovoracaceae bacterium]|nr:insulinase family protein [Bacteriovoracaceae bacterium]
MKTLLLLLAFFSIGCVQTTYSPAYKEKYQKRINELNSYPSFTLSNDLEVVVIPTELSKTQFGLTIASGSLNNPKGKEGLAHLLEHTVLLGSENYPSPGGLRDFISKSGGSFSAFTGPENTHYLFSIPTQNFDVSIQRFADFLSNPLFKSGVIKNEIKILESEHQKNKAVEFRRVVRIERLLHRTGHPIKFYGGGNRETLSKITRSDIVKYFDAHYSSNIMKVVIQTSISPKELRSQLEKSLGKITNKHLVLKNHHANLYSPSDLPRETIIHPIDPQTRNMFLFFEIPEINKNTTRGAIKVLDYLINNREKGSLSDYLITEGHILKIEGGVSPTAKRYGGSYMIKFEMTEKGIEKREEVLSSFYDYLSFLNRASVRPSLLDSIKKGHELRFIYPRSKVDLNYLLEASKALVDSSFTKFSTQDLFKNYDKNTFKELLQRFTLKKTNAFVMANIKLERPAFDKVMGITYMTTPIGSIKVDSTANEISKFSLPDPNNLLPLSLEQENFKQIAKRTNVGKLLYRFNQTNTPILKLEIKSKFLSSSIKDRILSEIILSCFKKESAALIGKIEQSNIIPKLELDEDGYSIALIGHNPNITKLPYLLYQRLEESIERCNIILATKNARNRALSMVPIVPYKRAIYELTNLMRSKSFDLSTLRKQEFHVTHKEIKNHFIKVARSSIVNLQGLGPYSPQKLEDDYHKMLKSFRRTGVTRPTFRPNVTRVISSGKQLYLDIKIDSTKSKAWLTHIQAGRNNPMNKAIIDFIWKFYINSTFTDTFRRKRQMGYIVGGNIDKAGSQLGINLLIQSEKTTLKQIIEETNSWISNIPTQLSSKLTKRTFAEVKVKYIKSIQKSYPKLAAAFKTVSYEELIKKTQSVFSQDSRAQISVYVSNKKINNFDRKEKIKEKISNPLN